MYAIGIKKYRCVINQNKYIMRKLLLFAVFAFLSLTVSAQDGLRIGVNAGIPVGDADIFSSFAGSIDVDYDWEVSNDVNVGVGTGLGNYFGKDGIDGFSYLPIVASGDVNISDTVSAGANVGYAISLESGGGGDLTWRLQVRLEISDEFDAQAIYDNISGDGITFSYIGVGFGFNL